jgi:YbbR domain-containing protein
MKALESPWFRFLLDNIGWILVSFVLAAIIWVVATLEENPIEEEQYRNPVPIEFIQPTEDDYSLFRSSTLRTSALVTVRAPRRTLEELARNDLRVIADLSNLPAGTHRVELIGEITDGGPPGRVVEVSPPDVTVEIVRVVTDNNVPLRIDTPGLAPGFRLDDVNCTPGTVTVSGPSSIVTRIARGVVQIDLQDSNTTFERTYPVELRTAIDDGILSNNERTNIQLQPETVICRAVMSVIEDGAQLLVGEPNFVGSLPEGYVQQDFTIEPPSVFVTGDSEAIAQLTDTVETESIDLTGQEDDFSREVAVQLPEGLQAEPATVTVTISIAPRTITRQFTGVPVRAINVAPSLSVTSLVPQSVDLTISGPEPVVAGLTLEDFRVTIDLQARVAGTYTELPLTTEVLRTINRSDITISTQPQNVNVVIAMPPTSTPTPSLDIWGG